MHLTSNKFTGGRYPLLLSVLLWSSISCLMLSCESNTGPKNSPSKEDFLLYLEKGDSIYATHSGYGGLAKSLEQFNAADSVAHLLGDSALIAEAIFARGRVYDAWNKKPEKTIHYFGEAARWFAQIDGQELRAGYAKYLLAHAYDKIQDSTNCVQVLQELYEELLILPDSIRRLHKFIPEMALAATTVKNYQLAEAVLNDLTRPEWIRNDPETYNYADRTYITRSLIDVYGYGKPKTPYTDSLIRVLWSSKSIFDRQYYSFLLNRIFEHTNQVDSAFKYLKLELETFNQLNNNSAGLASLHQELKKIQDERARQSMQIQQNSRLINILRTIISFLLVGGLFFYLYLQRKDKRKYIRINKELQVLNQDLDKKNEENQKLNMEIHHRVKNNLAVISSLLEMQERKAGDPATRQELSAARNRIRSIADTHRFMIEDGSVKNAADYIEQLLNGFVRSFRYQADAVKLQLETEAFSLTSRESFSVAIILNELVLNTFKHARIDGMEKLQIRVGVSRNEAGHLKLRYEDNGKASATEKQAETSSGMGLNIINMLAEDEAPQTTRYKYDLNIFA